MYELLEKEELFEDLEIDKTLELSETVKKYRMLMDEEIRILAEKGEINKIFEDEIPIKEVFEKDHKNEECYIRGDGSTEFIIGKLTSTLVKKDGNCVVRHKYFDTPEFIAVYDDNGSKTYLRRGDSLYFLIPKDHNLYGVGKRYIVMGVIPGNPTDESAWDEIIGD